MSARLVGWALAQPELDTQEKLLLVILADHFNDQEGAAWPSQSRVAELMNVSDRQVRRIQVQLINKGYLEVEQRTGQSNIYRMLTPDTGVHLPRTYMSTTPDTAVLHNSYITLNEHKKSKLKNNQSTPTPPKYKAPKDDSVKPEVAQEHIKQIRKTLRKAV